MLPRWRQGRTRVTAAAMPFSSSAAIDDAVWQRVLARAPGPAGYPPLYAPFLAAPRAADGCVVLGRIAQTLDGRIATESGMSFWISGPEDILHTHRLRAICEAILVGAGTVKADDPLLTTRLCAGPSPVRVVIDTDRRLEHGHRIFAGGPQTLLLVADDLAGADRLGTAEVLRIPRASSGGLAIPAVVAALAALRLHCRLPHSHACHANECRCQVRQCWSHRPETLHDRCLGKFAELVRRPGSVRPVS